MNTRKLSTFLAAILLLTTLTPLLATASTAQFTPMIRQGTSTSTNWSGYAVTANRGQTVTDVKGTWVVPAVVGTGVNAWSSFWVGIDGYNSNTVEQIGTDSDWNANTNSAIYYAWYEFYPQASVTIKTLTVHAGDIINAEVKYTGKAFQVSITDQTTGQSYSTTGKVNSAKQTSAEWIAEAPWSSKILPLADFGTVTFTACTATIGSTTAGIGNFPPANQQQINMVTSTGALKAQTSPLQTPQSFQVAWVSTG